MFSVSNKSGLTITVFLFQINPMVSEYCPAAHNFIHALFHEHFVAIMETGVKEKDAYHVACAVVAECNYFVTTDDRLLKYQSEKIKLVTPGEFIRRMEADE